MISKSQGETEVSEHLTRGHPEARWWFVERSRSAGAIPVAGPTPERDQTSIGGNGAGPSPKIEFGQTGRPRNRRCGGTGAGTPGRSPQGSEDRPVERRPIAAESIFSSHFDELLVGVHSGVAAELERLAGFVHGQQVSGQFAGDR